MWHYSAANRGFYNDTIHAALPGDAVEITEEEHESLLAAQAGGMEIMPGEGGRPVAAERVITPEQATGILKAEAQAALDRSDITVIRCVEHSAAVPETWLAYREELRAIVAGTSTATELPSRPEYPAGT